VIAQAGTLKVEFESNGLATPEVVGDTFVAFQNNIPLKFVVGGSTAAPPLHEVSLGNLFPFSKPPMPFPPEPYKLYAGDCEKNDPKTVAGVAYREAGVKPGETTTAKVEVPAITLNLYQGTTGNTPLVGADSALIINKECAAQNSQNLEPIPYEHKATITNAGHLANPYLPYAKELKLCVVSNLIGGKYTKNTYPLPNTKKEGTVYSKYIKEAIAGKEESASKLKCP
jgi:hypothetical protein